MPDALHHRSASFRGRMVQVFEPEGLFGEALADEFEKTVRKLSSQGQLDIRLNCGRIGVMDSVGVGVLISASTILKRQGGRLVIDIQGNHPIERLLAITKLRFDEDDDTEGQAGVRSPLSPPPAPRSMGEQAEPPSVE